MTPQVPDPLLIEEVARAQRSDRAEIDHIAGQLVIDRPAREDVDFGLVAALHDLQLARAADFAREPHAARAQDAPLGVEDDLAELGVLREELDVQDAAFLWYLASVAALVAAWAPNMLFGAAALYMLLTVRT